MGSRRQKGGEGGRILIENPRRGGVCQETGGGGGLRGLESAGKGGGVGLNFFFRGRNSLPFLLYLPPSFCAAGSLPKTSSFILGQGSLRALFRKHLPPL